MPELSSLLRQRLQAGENARLEHPDADTLTAYVEQLLPTAERKLVLQHMAVCGDCRDIVFLAMPADTVVAGAEAPEATVPAAVASPFPGRRRWFLSPKFGLAASIAAMAVALTLVVELPHKTQPFSAPPAVDQISRGQAPKASDTKETATGATSIPLSNAAAPVDSAVTSPSAAPLHELSRVPGETSRMTAGNAGNVAQKAAVGGNLNGDSRRRLNPEIMAQLASGKGDQIIEPIQVMPAPPAAQAEASQQDYLNAQRFSKDAGNSVAAQANLPSSPTPSGNSNQSTLLAGNWQQGSSAYLATPESQQQTKQGPVTFTPPPPEHQTLLSKLVEVGKRPIKRSEPPIQSGNVRGFAMFDKNVATQKSSEVVAAKTVESTDASNLAASPAFTSRGFGASRKSFLGSASIYRWKVLQGKLLKSADAAIWLEAYSATDGIEFTAVHSIGSEIWAGGNRGQLVHSRDGGTTWEKVAIGDAAVGNVVSIENTGLNVHVVTAPSQGWSSLDGGKSWLKLPQ